MEDNDIFESAPSGRRFLPDWLSFVLRRLLLIAGVAFGIVYVSMLGMRLSINSIGVGEPRTVSDLAEPALEETLSFFEDALSGDLGTVDPGGLQRTRVPLTEVIAETYILSAQLLAVAIGLATLVGIIAGGLAAVRSHSPVALSTLTLTVIGISIPSFFLALLFQVGALKFHSLTGIRLVSFFGPGLGRTESLLPRVTLPALVLTARPLAHITRITFVTVSDVLGQDYIRAARAKGLGPRIVFWRHTLRNAGISILTAVIVSLRFALGSLPVVEIFFEWPGLGYTILNAVSQRETELVASLALSLAVTFLLINLVVDLIYRFIDPRLRAQANGGGV